MGVSVHTARGPSNSCNTFKLPIRFAACYRAVTFARPFFSFVVFVLNLVLPVHLF